jgi:hypothetical protein
MMVKEFWRLITCLVSLAGFMVVTGSLLVRGDCLFWAVGRGVLVFLVLWVVQNLLGQLLGLVACAEPSQKASPERERRQ